MVIFYHIRNYLPNVILLNYSTLKKVYPSKKDKIIPIILNFFAQNSIKSHLMPKLYIKKN